MMKRLKIISIFILLYTGVSCGQKNIDKIISEIDNQDLSDLRGLTVYYRSEGHASKAKIYFVSSTTMNCSPYVVEYSAEKNTFNINNKLVLKSCQKDYLNSQTIKNAIHKYSELEVSLIKIDSIGNVYINPYEQAQATLLKISGSNIPNDINQFSLYKGNWYIKKE